MSDKKMMPILQVGDVLVSPDIITEKFCCDLDACKGICCVEGDAGAPVSMDEIAAIEDVVVEFVEFFDGFGVVEDVEGEFESFLDFFDGGDGEHAPKGPVLAGAVRDRGGDGAGVGGGPGGDFFQAPIVDEFAGNPNVEGGVALCGSDADVAAPGLGDIGEFAGAVFGGERHINGDELPAFWQFGAFGFDVAHERF